MKKILILYPHFPPSNLAGVHRPRLFAKHLPSFGWDPTILTVHEKYYEEALDHDLTALLPSTLRIEKVAAFKVGRIRLVGDIGLRAFVQLYRRAEELIKKETFDFLYIPVPSFYCALLGRWLHRNTGINYGIDYIDPWVHRFPGSEKTFSRHWWSTKLSGYLEPVAVKKASLITGVAEGYYQGVRQRNPQLARTCLFGAMPYGGEKADHEGLKRLSKTAYLFSKKEGVLQLVYAGAMLPKAYEMLEAICKAIRDNRAFFEKVEFHFIGTGKSPNDSNGHNIKPLAEKYGLWQTTIFEYPARIPYLDVLVHLDAAGGIFILGSTEPHYTPSKLYQAVLSNKPVLAVLHRQSEAFGVLEQARAGLTIGITGEDTSGLAEEFSPAVERFLAFQKGFRPAHRQLAPFEKFSAYRVTQQLATLLDKTQK